MVGPKEAVVTRLRHFTPFQNIASMFGINNIQKSTILGHETNYSVLDLLTFVQYHHTLQMKKFLNYFIAGLKLCCLGAGAGSRAEALPWSVSAKKKRRH